MQRAGKPRLGITIGQLADYAGVTVKAVRHYHSRGLLEEPPRDSSGYRRYTAEHAIHLVKIKTLAEAGVSLARIKELLSDGPDRFAAAIAEIDRARPVGHQPAVIKRPALRHQSPKNYDRIRSRLHHGSASCISSDH
jgi:DNA-binding transcriptional MerR regulator